MNKKLVLLTAAALTMATSAVAQKHVTGRVVDTSGQPVMGATVRVEGTKVHTVTDAEGRFTLPTVPESAKKLTVSYIGMTSQTVSVSGNVQVVMKDNELGEAVVVGYGSAKKVGTVVGAVKKVGGEKVADNPTANVADALQGKVAGLSILNNTGDVGQMNDVAITLRGTGSLSADNTPLLIIDGSPASTYMLSMLNDHDIESVTTLKDASATSIYGSRAANGVIYITTKKGRAGESAQVTIGQKIGWSQLAGVVGNPMNAIELLDFQLSNGIIQSDKYEEFKLHSANTDWQRYYFDRAAPMYQTDFALRGGSGSTTYYVSAQYLKQNALRKISHFNRYTLRANIETTPKEWLQFGLKQSAIYTDRQHDYWADGTTDNATTINNNINAYMNPSYWDPYTDEALRTHIPYGATDYDVNYYQTLRPSQINDIVYNGVAYLQLTPIKGLTIKSQLGLYLNDTRTEQSISANFPGIESAWAYEGHARSSMWTITNTAEYKFSIGANNAITLLAGQEGIKGQSKSFGVQGTGITDDRVGNLSSATAANPPSYASSKYEYLSFFGRIDYSLLSRYFVNLTVRNDKSSRFGADNRAARFVSGGVMWDVTAESFMQRAKDVLNSLQLRYSVGSTGNSEIGNYRSLGLTGTTQYNGQSGWVLSQPSNANLGWEKQIQHNIGIAARLLDRVSLDVNLYKRFTKDMLMSTPLPYTTGFASQMINIGEMSNRGIEVEFQYDILRTRNWNINFYANYSYNVNKIEKLFNDLEEYPMPSYMVNYVKGKSLNFYMPIYAGVDKTDGAPMWYKKGYSGDIQHEYNEETMTKEYSDDLYQDTGKKLQAPHNGGFGLTVAWKGLTLQADFAYVLGKYMWNLDYYYATTAGNAKNGFNQDKDMLHCWKNPGDITDIPSMQYDSQTDTRTLQNASFMRLKNLSLSYDLPKRWMQATGFIENVRFSFVGRNIFTITKYKGGNPEVDTNLAVGNYPATRQYTLGVEVTL